MATMSIIPLTAQTDGDGVNVTTASPIDGSDTTIHTAGASPDVDFVTLFAYNDDTVTRKLHVQWGDSADSIKVDVPPQAGLITVIVDQPIGDSNVVTASSEGSSVITIYGYAKRVDN